MDNEKIKDFRYFAADSIGVTANDNNVKLRFGIEETAGNITDQVGIFMTLKTLKLLNQMTTNLFEAFEKSGLVVEIDEAKLKEMKDAINPPDEGSK